MYGLSFLVNFLICLSALASGESLFEEALDGNAPPWPPASLQRILHDRLPQKRFSVHGTELMTPLVVARGRSLQAHCTSDEHPRLLTSRDSTRGHVYVGFSEKCKTAEVISWNPHRGAYDFLLVENYGEGLTPHMRLAHQNECMGCHQNRGPILSRFPWREYDNPESLKKLFERLDAERKNNKYLGFDLSSLREKMRMDRKTPPGLPLDCKKEKLDCTELPGRVNAVSYDTTVRQGSERVSVRRMCHEVCWKGIDCLSFSAKAALIAQNKYFPVKTVGARSYFPFAAHESEMQKGAKAVIEKHWPEHGFSLPSSVILDREPHNASFPLPNPQAYISVADPYSLQGLKPKDPASMRQALATESSEAKKFFIRYNQASSTFLFEKELPLMGKFFLQSEPTTERNDSLPLDKSDAIHIVEKGECFDVTEERKKELASYPIDAVLGLLSDPNFYRDVQKESRFLSGESLVEGIQRKLSSATSVPLPVVNQSYKFPQTAESLFLRSCNECHHKGSSYPPALPLTDLNALARYKAGLDFYIGSSVLQLLEDKSMPQANQHHIPITEEERKIMIDALKKARAKP